MPPVLLSSPGDRVDSPPAVPVKLQLASARTPHMAKPKPAKRPRTELQRRARAPPARSLRMPPGRRATINDIARLASVSKKTVSRVINQSPFVKEETRAKIDAVIQEIGYHPDPQARGLAFRRSFLIGLIYDNPNAQYIVNIQDGALDALRGSGFELVVHPCDRRSDDFIAGVRRFVERQKLHGVILLPPVSEDQNLTRALQEVGCEYVRIASVKLDATAHMVASNDREATAEVARYLESLGHQKIGLIAGPSQYRSAHERAGGFLSVLQQRGIQRAAGLHRRRRVHLRFRRGVRGGAARAQATAHCDFRVQ